ncbi:Tripartite DNA replication factor [Trapelia coarctata]|nr:Tripartite DNA replication factor [Trapelia coarctata]
MASKQQSFFDRKHNNRPRWHNQRRPQNEDGKDIPPSKIVVTAPPIVPSSKSRAKLQSFRFLQAVKPAETRESMSIHMDNENTNIAVDRSTRENEVPQSSKPGSRPQQVSTENPKPPPATPIGRVPFAELIGNNEDAFEQRPALTPVERVLWNHSPSSTDFANSLMTPAVRRGKKRHRSSSPPPSSREDALRKGPPFDLQTLQRSLTTPLVDPAGDLWSRYSINTREKPTPSKLAVHPPDDLLQSSSPQTPARHLRENDSSGLRRTMSCGTAWPTSAAKRRKIQKSHSQVVDGSMYEPAESHHAIGVSKVSFLLEKIHEGLAQNSVVSNETEQSSSSPPALKGASAIALAASPSERLPLTRQISPPAATIRSLQNTSHGDQIIHEVQVPEVRMEMFEKDSTSSDYGDDAIDEDFFNEVTASMQVPVPAKDMNRDAVPAVTREQIVERGEENDALQAATKIENDLCMGSRKDVIGGVIPPLQKLEANVGNNGSHAQGSDDFEFEDDDELFAADLEDMAAMYDQQTTPVDPRAPVINADLELPPKPKSSLAKSFALKTTSTAGGPDRVKEYVEVSSDDEFGEGLELEELACELTHTTQAAEAAASSHKQIRSSTIQRYLIVTVVTNQYETDKGCKRPEKILFVEEEKNKNKKVVILRQSWFDSPCTPGSYIHVLGTFDKDAQCIIDDAQSVLILHPDHLISATVVADSFSCTRRAVLQDRVKATNEANGPQVYGHILHEIFQEAMKANRWDTEFLAKTIETIAARYLETLFEIHVEIVQALDHLKSKVPELQSWAQVFVTARPRPDAVVKDRNGTHALMSVNKLLDVEEHVWSPKYGLKGNVDATVQVLMKDGTEERTLTVPFEIKTGKNHSNAAHKAQTALYTLLLSDRYDVQIAYGILYYMETSEISRIPAVRHELRHMIIQRNELASYVRRRLELPSMIKSPHLCGKCYAKTACFIYHKLVDDGDGESSGMKEKFDELVNHLKPIHQEFFKKWDDLLTKEETDVLKFRRELWTMLSSERERVGRCFGNVVIEPGSAIELTDAPKISRFRYTFIKPNAAAAFSFADSQITIGEPIVISDEEGHYALANGYVTHMRKHRIIVAVDRRLHNARTRGKAFDAENHQSFTGIMEVLADGNRPSISTPKESEEQILYRLDKDEFSNGMATVRNNLIRIMEKDLFGAQALRKLVVECVAPVFLPKLSMAFNTPSQASLNVDQRNAIEKVMCARDYALVLGMPGTGKTTTIAHIIRALAAQGKRILLTSYTHTAVDNILLKIRNDGIGIFRLGAVAKVHPEVQEFADLAGVPKTSVEELKRSYGNQVVATTCLGINHPIFNQRIFDYCIVDEASQITLPVCLGPIRMARTFILVGDHYQLPPLVQNKEAQEGGLDISLFKLLSEKHPSSVVNLEHQYRMCKDIMSLSNTLIYDGRLKCGTATVANREVVIPDMSALRIHHYSPSTLSPGLTSFCPGEISSACWIRHLLDPAVKVAFVNTDPLLPLSRETAKGSRITNPIEATFTTQLVESLLTVGVAAADIGVITLYRSQLALLKQHLRSKSTAASAVKAASAVEMHTADKFQGRDKEVIVLSLVRSNDAANVGDLLKDWRRVNVALTRARTKLIIVGSWDTMRKGSELLGKFCDLVSEKGWKYDLAKDSLGGHLFEEVITQSVRHVEDVGVKTKVEEGAGKKKSAGLGGRRLPEKKGKLDARALLGKRPVMRDIVNEAMA